MKTAVVLLSIIACSYAFQCYTCNNKPDEDDTQKCVESLETCPEDVSSCSTVTFKTNDGKTHTRKFCTSAGTPIYQYLLFFPGSSLCQNIETAEVSQGGPAPPAVVPGSRADRVDTISPPAPPNAHLGSLLCVCTKDSCNGGSYREVLDRTMLENVEDSAPHKPDDGPLQNLDNLRVR